jgi:hypothetical protein
MPATPVKIGPFAGGLNSYSGPTSIGDNEVIDIQNMDIDYDGSLYSRSPITQVESGATVPGTGELVLLGWYIAANGDKYLIASNATSTLVRNEQSDTWATITATFAATAMAQYANNAYLIAHPSEVDPGGLWTPGGGFVADADIPKGTSVCIYKERLFVAGSTTNPNRVYFSDAANFGVFQTTVNFFDVRAGDGQNVVAVYTFQDTIVIFKDDSTYVYSYDSAPSRGSVRLIAGAVGLTNKYCLVEYENSLYIHHEDNLHQIANWNFTVVNLKVPFEYIIKFDVGVYGSTNYPTLSVMSDRIIVHHYDVIYVFNLRMGVWTRWDIAENRNFNKFIEVPRSSLAEPERYYGGARNPNSGVNRALFEWRPEHDPTRSETIESFVVTKTYDFNVAYTFKRLFWWGVDLLSKKNLTYTVHPVAYSPGVTHAQMAAFKHNQILGNHLRPLSISIDVTDSRQISNAPGDRLFIKLIKGMRFRQIYFTLSGQTNGTTLEGPLRIYSIVAFIDNKQQVAKELS